MANMRNVVVVGAGLAGTSLLSFALGAMVTVLWLSPGRHARPNLPAPLAQANPPKAETAPALITPVPPGPPSPVQAKGPWGLKVGGNLSLDAAQAMRKRVEALGLPVRLESVAGAGGPSFTAVAGSFADRRSADQAVNWLIRADDLRAEVVSLAEAPK